MTPRRAPARPPRVALVVILALGVALPSLALPSLALAQPVEPYKQHMENGVKLFEDRNFDAAIVEFRAAYEARPKASPLINVALAYKARFKYPKAIEALETALAKHQDTMTPADIKAAEGELKDMRALLAHVKVTVTPPGAKITVDGEDLPAGAADAPIPLGPGTHKIAATAEGFAPADQSVSVASGEDTEVVLSLAADSAAVTVEAPDPRMTIAVDQRVMGTGRWSGLLPQGSHLVQVYGPGGQPYSAQILVVAGKPITVRPDASTSIPVPPPPPSSRPVPPLPPPKHGFYGIASGSLLFPTRYPKGFPGPEINSGGAGGIRAGYQVNGTAGFDLLFEHSSLYTPSLLTQGTGYTLIENRLGVDLRLMTPGKWVRGVGTIGGGLVFDSLSFDHPPIGCSADVCKPATGLDPYFLLEGGVEFEFSGVLLGLMLESQFQSSRGFTQAGGNAPPFGNEPLIHVGPSLRVGYAFW